MRAGAVALGGLLAWLPATAGAGVEDWQVNEVVTAAGGGTAARYVELRNDAGGCLFPSSRVQVFDGAGALLGQSAPVAATTCYDPGTIFLFAPAAAQQLFGVTADEMMLPPLPVAAGQVCFTSSTTRYDCVRWGPITDPVTDFFAAADGTSAAAPPMNLALARIATTHVVEGDWMIAGPTPGAPNDDPPWMQPDAGPTPDAGIDAGPTDAAPARDARPPVDARIRPDARDYYLDLEARGGAGCSAASPGAGMKPLVLLLLAAFAGRGRRARLSGRADNDCPADRTASG